jgi:tyrosine-protein kinase Etk/Wzc
MTSGIEHRHEIIEPFGPSYETQEAGSIDFKAVFQILHAARRTIGLLTLVCFVLSVALAFILRPRYTSTASFVPPSSSAGSSAALLAGQLSSMLGVGGAGGLKNQGDLYVGILKSRTIAATLVQRFDLKKVYRLRKESEAEKRLSQATTFESGLKDSIVSISVTDHSPDLARDLANGYLEALKSVNSHLALTESSQRRLFFENRLAQEKDALSNAEIAFKQSEEKTGIIAPGGQTASKLQELARLRAEIAARQTHLASLRQMETEQNPDFLRVQSEIASLQSQLSSMENSSRKDQFGSVSTNQIPALELEYTRRLREVRYHETLFGIIAKQYEAARIDEDNSVPLQILDQANVPDERSGPPRVLIILGGVFLGLLCGCCWALFRNRRNDDLWNRLPAQ